MKISGFDILDKLSEDRMTVIWKAHQNSLNRTVSIKMLRAQLSLDPTEVKNFFEEGKNVAKLKHMSIMQVYDVAEQNGTYFYVMEHVAGSTLAQIIDRGEKISPKRGLRILKQIAEALEYAWKTSHVIHRNIKPENIYIEKDDSVRLAFFGLSKAVDPLSVDGEKEQAKTIAGTPYYMSPEQAQGSSLMDCRTDMYSMGALLYQILTGHMPFHEFDPMVAADKQISDKIPHPRDVNPALSQGLCSFLSRLMMKDRKDRPTNWKEVIDDLSKLISGQLLLKRPDPDSKSTIEPEAKPIGAATSSSGAATALPRRNMVTIPTWVQLPAWACLLTWWYFLTRFMLDYWAP